jgi:8-oxo-dGTP diphosphatase
MSDRKPVTKIGLALIRNGHVLLVRRSGDPFLILPGGKPRAGESDIEALRREIEEELSCQLDESTLKHLGDYEDELVDDSERRVHVRLYVGELSGTPRPSAEIGELVWHPIGDLKEQSLAPSLRNQILGDLAGRTS